PSGAPCDLNRGNSCPSGQSCTATADGAFCLSHAPVDANGRTTDGPSPLLDGGTNCYGTGLVKDLCFMTPPSGSFVAATRAIDTATVGTTSCTAIIGQASGPSLCLIAADTISIPSGVTLSATGPNPLLLVATHTITIGGTLAVSSTEAGASGAGAQS